jgi:hypothetical protein
MPSLVDEYIHAGPISCSFATIAGSYMEGRCHFVDMEILRLFSPTLWLLDIWAGSGGVAYDESPNFRNLYIGLRAHVQDISHTGLSVTFIGIGYYIHTRCL